MLVLGDASLSKSQSVSGNLLTRDGYTLSYEYLNEPKPSAPSTMHAHRGVSADDGGPKKTPAWKENITRGAIGKISGPFTSGVRRTRRGHTESFLTLYQAIEI